MCRSIKTLRPPYTDDVAAVDEVTATHRLLAGVTISGKHVHSAAG